MKQAFIFFPKAGDLIQPEAKPTTNKKIIDISKHDGNIDFAKMKDDVSFVIARCSCGSDIDVRFDVYAQQMIDNNIPFGVYCYSYARDDAKAVDEAQKMVFYAARYNPLFFVIDAEEECLTRNTILKFCDELRKLGVHKVGCYVAHHRYKEYRYAEIADKFDFTWIPRYGKNDGTIEGSKRPDYPCDLWQYTDDGRIAGINEDVDLNTITGDGHDLEWFLGR